ncbi:hypothetical protein VNO78_15897 [Psophocarpus tetragonolobus]|uniref:Uncharacterized protein n=1 Tax=Psophocarpus tetragonolobus TaxID=3891 RepID=A0AAN9SFS1_PSOTE
MAKWLFLVAICGIVMVWPIAEAGKGMGMEMTWMPSMVEEEEEFGMDSEINRRILTGKRYISYRAMQKDTVPCSIPGGSYYNCQLGAPLNPYQRGCTIITSCKEDLCAFYEISLVMRTCYCISKSTYKLFRGSMSWRIITIHANQKIAQECYMASLKITPMVDDLPTKPKAPQSDIVAMMELDPKINDNS